ncbi:somatostatin receptor type 2-like [Actinia tenebrosa]|uniref:Somatostatin receptor type 2-like n=1 Tax=Actinia tenebrosa TaxID=6105 RepID=A0A6P8I2H9_ACTTE|nr:somatostatin receptor type 2-like [Actinia tenebrosa]XP_031561726.1 somatostatin receptor type 2-like [Actinia tenebrosa]XP_031561727.1 somatostatin receptor type 2-like [Actinia tenebrosa]
MMTLLEESLWSSAYGIIAVFVIVGNSLSIYLFVGNLRLRRMRTTILLLNLSIADLIVGSVTLPMYMALTWPGTNYALQQNPGFYMSFICIDVLTGFGSVFGLTVIALERVYSVFLPHHHRRAKRKMYLAMIVLIWGLTVIQTLLRVLFDLEVISLEGFFSCVMISLTVSLIIICVAYIAVWIKVNIKQPRQVNRATLNDHKTENKLAVTLAIITVIFIFTWIPFHILNITMFFCVECRSLPIKYVNFFKLLHYSNSLINPLVYSSRFPEFKRTLKTMFCCQSSAVQPMVSNNMEQSQSHLSVTPYLRQGRVSIISM